MSAKLIRADISPELLKAHASAVRGTEKWAALALLLYDDRRSAVRHAAEVLLEFSAHPSTAGGNGGKGGKYRPVLVNELARRVNRSPDTIKRWVEEGLLECWRDERNRRQFSEASVDRGLDLARLSVAAQLQNKKLRELVAEIPEQLLLLAP
jgi:MerR HTH family regulatory protein